MKEKENWYEIAGIDALDSPVLVVYPERVKANIATAIHMLGDVNRLRPHIKTHKSPAVVQLLLNAGVNRFKCATIAEAEMLGMTGATDVLLAYQPLGPKLQRFIQLVKKYPATSFSCITDQLAAATEMAAAFAANQLTMPVYIDLNTGMNRTGMAPGEEAADLYRFLSTNKNIQAAGLHAYDGHIRDQDINLRTAQCNEAFEQVLSFKAILEKESFAVPVIVAGGSPSFPVHVQRKEVECSPGTFVYWDKGYLNACPEQDFLPAAVLITRIISLPGPGLICTDLGHKSVAAENEIGRRVYFLNAPELTVTGQSEEHLTATAPVDHSFKPGDILYALPYHVCPTVALYERVITIENGKVSGEWMNTARDRRISI